jgi:multiple sugar transport system permease protein
MIAPLAIIMLALYAYPVVDSLFMTFTKYDYAVMNSHPVWIGLQNFVNFAKSPDSRRVVYNTVTFTLIVVFIETALGLSLALAFNRQFLGRGVARALVLVPLMLAPVVVGYEWRWLYNDPYGLINIALMRMHVIKAPIAFTTSAKFAMVSLVVADIWYSTPFVAVLCMGGLQSLPEEPFESAIIDGASAMQRFLYITLPLLRPVLMAAILIRTMDAFQTFDLVFILTYGGPGNLTELMNTFTYKVAFHNFDLGYASTISVVSLILMMLIGLALIRITRRNA